jgi:adenylate cyclase
MPADHVERKLSAIVAADVAGYSRLMGADEEGTLASLNGHLRDLVNPSIAAHRGRVVKTTGDGLLAEFASVVDAVRCAIEVQSGMAARNAGVAPDRRLDFRIGINVGDIVEQDGDIFGDGVNIAARLEGIADPGGICVSARVQEDAAGKIDLPFEDIGAQALKNISRPIPAFRIRLDGVASPAPRPALSLPNKPSIAVLPFQNMSGEAEQDYFADGMVEEIITALSRVRWLFVIARNSSFTYKGRAVDVKQIGRELGVRYLLEGSIRKAGSRVRITGQLIDTATGAHLWAERFEGNLEDVFDLQDQVTARVVGAINPKLEQAEIDRARRKPPESLDAYDYFLRGLAAFYQWTQETNDEALAMFYKAIELDPDFAATYGLAARCYARRKSFGWVIDRDSETAETVRLARRAADLGKNDAVALFCAGIALAFVVGDLDDGDALIERALVVDPNLAVAWAFSGWVKVWLGQPEAGVERAARAMRLSPHDPQTHNMQAATAAAHFFAGRNEDALSWAETSIRAQPGYVLTLAVAAASAALAGKESVAGKAMTRLRQLVPQLRIANVEAEIFPVRRPDDLQRWTEALRKAGLPD